MKITLFWSLLLASLVTACSSAPEPASVTAAWIRNAPPSASVLAGYMVFDNPDSRPLVVLSASSPRFEKVEFHHMRMADGQMLMRELPQLDIEPNSQRVLSPGADHLMLIGPQTPVVAGERIPVQLEVQEASGDIYMLPVEFLVRHRAPR